MPFLYIYSNLACDFAVFVIKINRHQLITTVIILPSNKGGGEGAVADTS